MSDLPLVKSNQFSVKPDLDNFENSRIAAFLRTRHPTKTAECVQAEADIPADTVRQWLKGVSRPGFVGLLSLIGAYGPEFLAAALPNAPAWLEGAVREQRRVALDAERAALMRRLGEIEDADAGISTCGLDAGMGDRPRGELGPHDGGRMGGEDCRGLRDEGA